MAEENATRLVRLYLTAHDPSSVTGPIRDGMDREAVERALAALQRLSGVRLGIRARPRLRIRPARAPGQGRDPRRAAAGGAAEPPATFGLDPVPQPAVQRLARALDGDKDLAAFSLAADLPVSAADGWCPAQAGQPLFTRLDHALALIGQDSLAAAGGTGAGVNVVIIDQGIDRRFIPAANWGGGWEVDPNLAANSPPPRLPGQAAYGHGTRMALAVLAVAPAARIWDLPLLPQHIDDLEGYLYLAQQAFDTLAVDLPKTGGGRWVLCNAWSVYDLRTDPAPLPPPGNPNYAGNPRHPLCRSVDAIAAAARAPGRFTDVVFAAGNCGLHCPDARCGPGQVGPGNSIYGVAALGSVLSLGAVRTDAMWLGYASQGPSPAAFHSAKPDLCAPSQFADPRDAGRAYTGTSAACALTAGALAGLRSTAAHQGHASAEMFKRLRKAARPVAGAGPGDLRVGAGILDLRQV